MWVALRGTKGASPCCQRPGFGHPPAPQSHALQAADTALGGTQPQILLVTPSCHPTRGDRAKDMSAEKWADLAEEQSHIPAQGNPRGAKPSAGRTGGSGGESSVPGSTHPPPTPCYPLPLVTPSLTAGQPGPRRPAQRRQAQRRSRQHRPGSSQRLAAAGAGVGWGGAFFSSSSSSWARSSPLAAARPPARCARRWHRHPQWGSGRSSPCSPSAGCFFRNRLKTENGRKLGFQQRWITAEPAFPPPGSCWRGNRCAPLSGIPGCLQLKLCSEPSAGCGKGESSKETPDRSSRGYRFHSDTDVNNLRI